MLLIVINHTIDMGARIPVGYGYPAIEGGVRILLSLIQGLGVFAVPTFLFISGTFISYAARGEPPRLTAKFLAGSISHIWWPYLLWSCVFYGVVLLQFGESYTLAGYLKNLLVGYPYHFIPLLLVFYLLAPLLVRLGKRHGPLLIGAIGAYQLLLLCLLHTELLPDRLDILIPPGLSGTLADWAVYFPLGLIYGLHMRSMVPHLRKLRLPLVAATVLFFILGSLHYNGIISFPVAGSLAALAFVMLLPTIDRTSIPLVATLEGIGKRSYGLYLTHLIVLDLVLLGIGTFVPGLFHYRLALLPVLFVITLQVPMVAMKAMARSPLRSVYRYLFG